RRFRGGGAVGLLPVFSNVGEPAQCLPGEQRASQLAIFGSEEWRRLAVSRDLDALAAACRALAIDQIVDIGPGSIPHPDLPDIQWIVTGPLPAKEVSRWLARCRAGFSSYPSHCFGKSGIIAAYMAHGLPLVVPRHSIRREVDTLELGSHYLVAEEIGNDGICVAAKMVTECFRWHQGHRIDHQVSKFADQLNAAYD
ncbi:MAG: hypothetical protein ABIT37_14380, partial [Luteolibacter sp.]